MRSQIGTITAMMFGVTLAGCVGTEEVLFVTSTNIGIDADSKPPNLAIAYYRAEGYIAPSYDNGALPPVLARIQSNLNPFDPVVRQVYATGDAAISLAQNAPPSPAGRELRQRNKRVAYFVTESSVGLRVTFAGNLPDSVHLGYKRKEFSYIPIGTSTSGNCADAQTFSGIENSVDCYASVLANIEMGGKISDQKSTGLQLNQFFATGRAAEYLASENPDVRRMFLQQTIKSDISAIYNCDENCEKIREYIGKNGTAGSTTVQDKCLTPNHIVYPTDLYYLDQYKDARAQCAQSLSP